MRALGYQQNRRDLRRLRNAIVALGWTIVLGMGSASADTEDQAFVAVRGALQQQLRHPRTETRLAAVQKLESFPTVGAAKLLIAHGLHPSPPELRHASYLALLKFRNVPAVCQYLHETLQKELGRAEAQPKSSILLAVLLASDLPEAQLGAHELLERAARLPARHGSFLTALADELGRQGDDTSFASLVRLTKLSLFERDFGFRRATVQALTRVRRSEAIDVLVGILGSVQGEVRADILRHLAQVSGQRPELNGPWEEWWRANRDSFVFPPALDGFAPARDAELFRGLPSYYEIPVCAQRTLFVLDTSTSMSGPRILRAKQELIRAIQELPGDVTFNILVFNGHVGDWQKRMVEASPDHKKLAIQFVQRQGLDSNTASYDALKAAFRYDAEAIYFLTDGEPNAGRIRTPREIVAAITEENQRRRITLNVIGVGVGPRGNVFDTFLSSLASRNFGEYRRVDQ